MVSLKIIANLTLVFFFTKNSRYIVGSYTRSIDENIEPDVALIILCYKHNYNYLIIMFQVNRQNYKKFKKKIITNVLMLLFPNGKTNIILN